MSDRERLPELIDRFNSGDLSGEELANFLEMMKASPRLREEVRLDKELNELLAEEDIIELRRRILEISMSRRKKKGPDLRIFLMAASLLLLLAIEVLLFLNHRNPGPVLNTRLFPRFHPEMKKTKERIKPESIVVSPGPDKKQKGMNKSEPKKLLAASFKANPTFENLIGSTRTGNFKMEAPAIGYKFDRKEMIRFKWNMEGKEDINLTIMDHLGTVVHEATLQNTRSYSLDGGTLKEGLYYFRIMQKDEIVFFGKFTVNSSSEFY